MFSLEKGRLKGDLISAYSIYQNDRDITEPQGLEEVHAAAIAAAA